MCALAGRLIDLGSIDDALVLLTLIHSCYQDEVIDVIEGNRKYIRCLYAYNKIDTITIEEVDKLAREPDAIVISVRMRLNLERLLAKMWDYMGLIRVYTKRRGAPPMFHEPLVLSSERKGISVEVRARALLL